MMSLFLTELAWWQSITTVYVGLGVVVAVLISLVTFLSLNRKEIQQTDRERATSSEGLVKTRDIQILDLEKKCRKQAEELEDLTAEHRTLIGINLDLLFKYWAVREHEIADKERVISENRVLRIRLGDVKD